MPVVDLHVKELNHAFLVKNMLALPKRHYCQLLSEIFDTNLALELTILLSFLFQPNFIDFFPVLLLNLPYQGLSFSFFLLLRLC